MRGSVYHQTANLVKVIYVEHAKKEERVDPEHDYYQCVASYSTMDTYRTVWNNFFNYLREHWKIKNCELITEEHVQAYFEYKIEYYLSKQYVEKISAALGKLETALTKYSKSYKDIPIVYDFSIRQNILNYARDYKLVANNYVNRTYQNSEIIINNLSNLEHQIAASIQLQGGARAEGVLLIKKEQLKGYKIDEISQEKRGIIETREKGGKVGDVLILPNIYSQLEDYYMNTKKSVFKLNRQHYTNDIKYVCKGLNIIPKGSHGFRWTFAQNRVREYQKNGYSYEQALQGVSWEMKHYRANITEHYLG